MVAAPAVAVLGDLPAGLGGVGVAVILLRQVQTLGGHIGVRLRALPDGLHLALEEQAHGQRQHHADAQRHRQHLHQRLSDGVALLRQTQVLVAGGQVILEAAHPVVVAEVVQEHLRHLVASVLVDRVLGGAVVADKQVVVAVVHTQHQHDALAVFTDAEVIAVVDVGRRVVDIAVVVLVVVHGDDVDGAVVPPGDLVGHHLQLQPLILGQQARFIVHEQIVRRLLRPSGYDQRQRRQQRQQPCKSSLFHLGCPPYISIRIAAAMAVTGAAIAAKIPQNLPISVGRSPTSLPVCPFMAKRKSLPFHLVCSIHTGSSA